MQVLKSFEGHGAHRRGVRGEGEVKGRREARGWGARGRTWERAGNSLKSVLCRMRDAVFEGHVAFRVSNPLTRFQGLAVRYAAPHRYHLTDAGPCKIERSFVYFLGEQGS
jgi:hypothetical protein